MEAVVGACSPEEGIGNIEVERWQVLRWCPTWKVIVCKQPSTSMASFRLCVDTSATPRSWERDTNFRTPDEVPNDSPDPRIPLVDDLVVDYPVEPNVEGFQGVAWLRVVASNVAQNARIQAALWCRLELGRLTKQPLRTGIKIIFFCIAISLPLNCGIVIEKQMKLKY